MPYNNSTMALSALYLNSTPKLEPAKSLSMSNLVVAEYDNEPSTVVTDDGLVIEDLVDEYYNDEKG